MLRLLTLFLVLAASGTVFAGGQQADTAIVAVAGDSVSTDSVKKRGKGPIAWLLRYIKNSNKNRKRRRFDFSVIGGPHYSTDTRLGLGIVGTGLYRTDLKDTLLPPSNTAIYGDVTTANYYKIGIRGTHIFPRGRHRLEYDLSFDWFKSKFWGIGYDMGNNDDNESRMDRCQLEGRTAFLWQINGSLYAGPALVFDYVSTDNIERPELLCGMDRHAWNVGWGVRLVMDSRDVLTNAHKGVLISLSQYVRPAFLGSGKAFYTTDLRADGYVRAWTGAVIAADARCTLNFGSPSWGLMALLGNSYSMRGYYEGRYRDKHKLEAQVELRQHVWRRHGVVAWCGAGTVFSKFGRLRSRHILPNFGVGYRWEFKKDMNIRLDYGFGKAGQQGFIFNIGEAF